MQTITIAATAQHGFGFPALAAVAISIVVAGIVAWQVVTRMRAFRHDEHLSHSGH